MPSLASFHPTRDLTSTLHHRRSISYDDHLSCSHMPMLTEFMTCIFPPSYFLFLFVCVPSIYSFYSPLPPSYCVPTYLRLYSVPVLALQSSLSRLALCAVFMSISHSRPSTLTSIVPHSSPPNCRRALDLTSLILISYSVIPTRLHPTSSPKILATKNQADIS
jgi:hypothetical protein